LKRLVIWLNNVTIVAQSVRLLPTHMREDVYATHQLHCQWCQWHARHAEKRCFSLQHLFKL